MARNKDYDYFKKFVEQVGYCSQSAGLLHEIVKQFNPKLMEKNLKELHKIEHTADFKKHEMMQQLASEFIAPIEREDIVQLSQSIDDITDDIEDVLITMYMYNITRIKPEVLKFTSLISTCCAALQTAMQEFHNFKKSTTLMDKLIEVNRLEEQGDSLYLETVRQMYLNVTNPTELYIWSVIFEKLEKCADSCEHVADAVESICMKNS